MRIVQTNVITNTAGSTSRLERGFTVRRTETQFITLHSGVVGILRGRPCVYSVLITGAGVIVIIGFCAVLVSVFCGFECTGGREKFITAGLCG